jgi:hypothetical protein
LGKKVHPKEKELLEVEIERSVATTAGGYFFVITKDKTAINFLWV